ncbi:hypothetical protein E5676_scaffold1737G001500 [Cucumis melo var. makuwa]|uniref:Uncharacterized protein n=1 Tax=Cucumis melo var. makuwa TaxID=1194695 RepID=A0A5A7UAL3_CUCMM|nr:hypothetical protein E6C27_scaffold673G00510 [Cucumis melo var. makuwa]TYK07849.1 hypothetical protein E5676_scaffold1737G001500 [Cucumis melo var. makuwa]
MLLLRFLSRLYTLLKDRQQITLSLLSGFVKRPEIATVLSGIEKIHADCLTTLEEYLNNYLKRDEVNTLESTHAITEKAIEALAMVRKSMEAAREEFKNFKWKL